ncbi:MAG TPA: ABC transporter permease [Egibacteraceae bacterium]|nr:ABC transporter permease [Actinomycetota bacterium]HWB70899.1 ABC transporter permease [Egibacteraceae bacterium]
MWAIGIKEFRQLRRDRRTLALMIVAPMLLLVVFGYAARFDVDEVPTVLVGEDAGQIAQLAPDEFAVVDARAGGRAEAEDALQRGEAAVALVAGPAPIVLVDGAELFSAQAALRALAGSAQVAQPAPRPQVEVLFNPQLQTSAVMVPAIAGMIVVFIGTVITSLGVVRERQAGTLEQLGVMPFRPRDVFVGKVAPYFVVASIDLAAVVGISVWLFDVPFRGSAGTLVLGSLLFLFVTLGMGILISSVSENQGQAVQLALMAVLPQVLLSGMIFPIESMAAGVRWIAYLLPLTYFIELARGVMLRAAPVDALWLPLAMLAALGVAVFGLAVVRFRRDLAPAGRRTPQRTRPRTRALEAVR